MRLTIVSLFFYECSLDTPFPAAPLRIILLIRVDKCKPH